MVQKKSQYFVDFFFTRNANKNGHRTGRHGVQLDEKKGWVGEGGLSTQIVAEWNIFGYHVVLVARSTPPVKKRPPLGFRNEMCLRTGLLWFLCHHVTGHWGSIDQKRKRKMKIAYERKKETACASSLPCVPVGVRPQQVEGKSCPTVSCKQTINWLLLWDRMRWGWPNCLFFLCVNIIVAIATPPYFPLFVPAGFLFLVSGECPHLGVERYFSMMVFCCKFKTHTYSRLFS